MPSLIHIPRAPVVRTLHEYPVGVLVLAGEKQEYITYYLDASGTDFDILPGNEYFVKTLYDTTLTLYITTEISDTTLHLNTGMNLIGWNSLEPTDAETLAQSIEHCTKTSKWDVENDTWIDHIPDTEENNFEIEPGLGYAVWVSEVVTVLM